jgi:hypothetical protein
MDQDTRWATLLAENQNLRVLYSSLPSEIEEERIIQQELLDIREQLIKHYEGEYLTSQGYVKENQVIADQLFKCQDDIPRLQGIIQNIQYNIDGIREKSETKTKRKSKKRKSRF